MPLNRFRKGEYDAGQLSLALSLLHVAGTVSALGPELAYSWGGA